MKRSTFLCVLSVLAEGLFFTADATAQSKAYRQINLASDVQGAANNFSPRQQNSWGLAFLSGQPFFIANQNSGAVTVLDGTGLGERPGSFNVSTADAAGNDTPTGIVADQNSLFGGRTFVQPFIIATDSGRIFLWGPDPQGDLPPTATLVRDNSLQGAVYKGIALVTPPGANPAVAVTNFHTGFVETFLPSFDRVALAGSFTDSNLPPGYAPFGIQVIGNQVFVTYALQDAAKHDPIAGVGNGIVSIFDMDGNFVRRFATGGVLNAPWGITQASANFGPFSNDILIGNVGDGTINAFDPATGEFVGQIRDGDGNVVVNSGLHALAFRADRFGDPNTLYFTAGTNNGQDGLFGAISVGLLSSTRVAVEPTPTDTPVPVAIAVSAGPGNVGTPTGQVTVLDGGVQIAAVSLINGAISFPEIFTRAGNHIIEAAYGGDANFLPSTSQIEVEVAGLSTTLSLAAPANAAPGSTIILTATLNSAGGIPTGNIVFHDGNTTLGTAPLDATGIAVLRTNTLAAGPHTLTATYPGDGKFGNSNSLVVSLTIASADFALVATPPSAQVVAGQSTQFMLRVTSAGGFAGTVTFSCSPNTGITCSFNPPTLTPGNGAANTTLTVTTSASVTRYAFLLFNFVGSASFFGGLAIFAFIFTSAGKMHAPRTILLPSAAVVLICALSLALDGCGGYGSTAQPNRGMASINVTASSGAISHSTTVNVTVQ